MNILIMKYLISIICLFLNIENVLMVSSIPKLLIVSYDAFRYDYFNRNITPHMKELKEEGTDVDYMMNAFVTRTLPNHHTMATGFYIETHGVLENRMFNKNGTILKNQSDVFHYNNNILPIWTINEKNGSGSHSGSMMWPGGEFDYGGVVPKFFTPLNVTTSWETRFDTLVSWFLHPKTPINLGILYIEEPDFHAHAYGTEHPVVNELLKKLDTFTYYIYNKLKDNNLTDVNVIHLSDHGMTEVNISRIINISQIIDLSDCEYLPTSNTIFIIPHPGKEEILYDKLNSAANETSKFRVYRKEEIPERFHYGNNERMTPIFVVAENGYAFEFLRDSFDYYKKTFNITIDDKSLFGIHGYDNEDKNMHPMFFARGPAFKSHCKLEPFHNVDLFPLFCNILNLECPPTNGTVNSFKKCLKSFSNNDEQKKSYSMLVPVLVALSVVGTISMLIGLYLRLKRRKEEVLYRILDDAKMEHLWDEHQDLENMWH
ncbi:bis(5'-adenosyl)-triphosphatase enpp4 isoform X2 [Microplitis demolitor]|uniref:bis(5'-adenosyl)-triphosphatase enpp4 isoform X2 n=1 Tax=Microplitis demolitor TaxID=69319 RepID=UPI0006D4CD3A|nr:bis(5'-adenosyl)-triphosphatase enpp4 isoform X2 [Microplitis demolitor]